MTHAKDEALRMALDALEGAKIIGGQRKADEAITAIKQALAAPVQEPIYQMQMMDGKWIDQAKQSYEYNKARGNTVRIVYTTPPAQPAPVPLTDEMRKQMKERCDSMEMRGAFADGWLSAESAHGITKGQP
jgi:hypothetical protein